MASDLKIEIFAFNTFHNLWYTCGVTKTLPDVLEVYEDECNKVNNFMEALDIQFDPVIFLRHSLFINVYRKVLNDELIERLKAPLDCYHYVLRICDSDELFGHLTVFQRVFATLTFVWILCLRMYDIGNNIDIVKYGHLFWVMHFDKFTEEFYEKGGWEMLQIETKLYEYLFDFHHAFNKCIFNIQKMKQATVNFFLSKDSVQSEERKQKHPACFSKLWIKFRISDFVNYVMIPLSYETYIDSMGLEILLEELKLILVPLRSTSSDSRMTNEHQASAIPKAISLTELDNATKEIQASYERVQAITCEQSRIIDKVFDDFLSIQSGFEKKTCTECALCEHEQLNLAITNKEKNLEFEKFTLTETEISQQTISVDSTKNSNTEEDILQVVYRNKKSNTSNKDSINAGDSYHICGNESHINKLESGKTDNVCKVNIKRWDSFAVTSQATSMNKTVESISPEKISSQTNSSLVSKYFSCVDKRKQTTNVQEDFKNEQIDPVMKHFLKMILVLGDKEATKSVLSKLQINEGGTENSQETSKKKKKRPKKKSVK